ncbi:antibiotic biosynthesis monooxygenase [Flavobacteriaceae bacterium R38]|nr:antibiotic biosynthesis monooxygenase [Flavobacteriaceae bacterium R38]
MLVRIVKLTFDSSKVDDFLINFDKNKNQIRNFNGCRFLELYRDKENPSVFFTYSYWDSEDDLENYRNSSLFKNIWKVTKTWFAAKPEAWSVDKIASLE